MNATFVIVQAGGVYLGPVIADLLQLKEAESCHIVSVLRTEAADVGNVARRRGRAPRRDIEAGEARRTG